MKAAQPPPAHYQFRGLGIVHTFYQVPGDQYPGAELDANGKITLRRETPTENVWEGGAKPFYVTSLEQLTGWNALVATEPDKFSDKEETIRRQCFIANKIRGLMEGNPLSCKHKLDDAVWLTDKFANQGQTSRSMGITDFNMDMAGRFYLVVLEERFQQFGPSDDYHGDMNITVLIQVFDEASKAWLAVEVDPQGVPFRCSQWAPHGDPRFEEDWHAGLHYLAANGRQHGLSNYGGGVVVPVPDWFTVEAYCGDILAARHDAHRAQIQEAAAACVGSCAYTPDMATMACVSAGSSFTQQ